MKRVNVLIVFGFLVSFSWTAVLTGVESEKPYTYFGGFFECEIEIFESEFSKWHLILDMQRIFDQKGEDKIRVYQEGRDYRGVAQIRWVEREMQKDTECFIHGMMTHDEFYSRDTRFHSEGYRRASMQVFKDASGVARHQAVWIKDSTAGTED
jgi:hypothetical protein